VGCNTVSHARDEGGGAGDFEMPSKRKSRPRGRLCERRLCVPVEVRTASRRASDASDHQPAGRIVLPGCSNCISDSRANGSLVSLLNNQIEHRYQQRLYQKPKQQCIQVFQKRRSHRNVVPQGTSQWITKPTASTRPPPVSLYRSVWRQYILCVECSQNGRVMSYGRANAPGAHITALTSPEQPPCHVFQEKQANMNSAWRQGKPQNKFSYPGTTR